MLLVSHDGLGMSVRSSSTGLDGRPGIQARVVLEAYLGKQGRSREPVAIVWASKFGSGGSGGSGGSDKCLLCTVDAAVWMVRDDGHGGNGVLNDAIGNRNSARTEPS